MNRETIKEELERKKKFIRFLSNAIFLLLDAINERDEGDITKYRKFAIDSIDAIIKINSHGELKSEDTREEDAKLGELKKSVKELSNDISSKYNALQSSLKPKK
ncbi:MAG: hypothetical protein KKG75_04945 [Nanoarchaeota archaeon]|nr:hypothetical protein [Nanoarchaeota archaeon]